ncbi:LysR substrate-binding domain-containing protein [Polaromonas sp.]|uniref:LysR family transcriptional regulator n=1 Tax=Polaromonas sp. TaxID=1869339 RepID=UPI002488AEEC|nr:LysR substrate-binding domain-containing protein [Polaromonas sp.]MDI1273442.1 LysR substrate-binding domain-containing protein [Polaromonas sp.]
MELSDLAIFRAVVEAGGVTRAAERLHRVQSNITTRIRQLEEKLGTPLFIREGKRLHLSPAGQVLLDYAQRLLALADEARDAVRDGSPRGALVLGAMESTSAVRLPGPLSDFVRLYPEVKLTLKTGNPQQLAAAVLAGSMDAALVTGPIAKGPFERVPIYSEELVIVASAGHAAITSPTARGAEPPRSMVAFEQGCPHRARLEQWYAGKNSMPVQTIEITSYHAMLGCVVVGMGISLVPLSVLATFPERARLSVHPLPPGSDRAQTDLIWRKGAMSPRIRALLEVLKPSA